MNKLCLSWSVSPPENIYEHNLLTVELNFILHLHRRDFGGWIYTGTSLIFNSLAPRSYVFLGCEHVRKHMKSNVCDHLPLKG